MIWWACMTGTDATTQRTSHRFAGAKAGNNRLVLYRVALLLDYRQGIPAAPVGQSLYSLAPRDIFWRRHPRARTGAVLWPDVARTRAIQTFPCVDGRALARAKRGAFVTSNFGSRCTI